MTVQLGALTPADVHPVARLHRSAFPTFFLSTLGEGFLVEFYRGFLTDDSAVTVVARDAGGSVQGAVVGTTEPAGFFRRLLVNRWRGFLVASIRAVFVHPAAAPRLLGALRYRGDTPGSAGGALLSSICVAPSAQGTGLGRRLVDAWTHEVSARGVETAYLTTDAEHNDRVNHFYQAGGWKVSDHYTTQQGRAMNRYTKSLGVR